MEKLIIDTRYKSLLGVIIRQLRKQHGWTQQQLLEYSGHPLSLRTLVALEQGYCCKEDDIYDELLQALHASYCYQRTWLDTWQTQLDALWESFVRYDTSACIKHLTEAKKQLQKHTGYPLEDTFRHLCQLLLDHLQQRRLTKDDLAFVQEITPFCLEPLPVLLQDLLYRQEYTYTHRDRELEHIYTTSKHLQRPQNTRNATTACLQLYDKRKQYLSAYQLMQRRLQIEKAADNPAALFQAMHWLMNMAAQLEPNVFEHYREQAEKLAEQITIDEKQLYAFYCNIAGAYSRQWQLEKSMAYYQKAQVSKQPSPLPELIWMCAIQHRINKQLPSIDFTIDVSQSSEAMQTCWRYFVMKSEKRPATELERYIMKALIPILKEIAVEFRIVYKEQLETLVPQTRSYRLLLLYTQQCPLSLAI